MASATAMLSRQSLQSKPLPSLPSPTLTLPSPTLTNPEMVLPSEAGLYGMDSPSRSRRPPSPSYLRDRASQSTPRDNTGEKSVTTPPQRREKRGLMSRKMMLMRSRTGSGMSVNGQITPPRSVLDEQQDGALASSPVLHDLGKLVPESVDTKRSSASSLFSDDLEGLPKFLARYNDTAVDSGTDEDMFGAESPAIHSPTGPQYGYGLGISADKILDDERSQALSRRAEIILANAKERLNLMEGNLRTARSTISAAPLTAANLRRATSLGSSAFSSERSEELNQSHKRSSEVRRNSIGRGRFLPNGYHYEPAPQQRVLHSQNFSLTMGSQYAGHARNSSDNSLPHTALARTGSFQKGPRMVQIKPQEGTAWTTTLRESRSEDFSSGSAGGGASMLRNSRSHDSLQYGGAGGRTTPLQKHKGSPDSQLDTLREDDTSAADRDDGQRAIGNGDGKKIGLGLSRPPSTTEDLREQMSSLRGRISSLREKANEDSMRRQSMQTLRSASSFTSAQTASPELWYRQSPNHSSPVLDTNVGVGWSVTPPINEFRMWETTPPQLQQQTFPRSRHAFPTQQQIRKSASVSPRRPSPERQLDAETPKVKKEHKRNESGSAYVMPAEQRFSHHKFSYAHGLAMHVPGEYVHSDRGNEVFPLGAPDDVRDGVEYKARVNSLPSPPSPDGGDSVYEDVEVAQPAVSRHEDREDAFDYEHFFLHSAMRSYSKAPPSSCASSSSSASTARGPSAAVDLDTPPPTPETPAELRDIERGYLAKHTRSMSHESTSTTATFATAQERRASALDWPMSPSDTQAQQPTGNGHRSSSSDRADSGVGLSHRSPSPSAKSGASTPRSPLPPLGRGTDTVPSPDALAQVLHDPASAAVAALLEPGGRQLALKDSALLCGVIESLRKVCRRLQEQEEEGEAQYEKRTFRRRLDDARRVLDGGGPESSPP